MTTLFCSETCDFVTDMNQVQMTIDVPPMLDQVILSDSRVLQNMMLEELMMTKQDYCFNVQSNIAPHMRKIVTDWMLEVCEDQQCQPEVFFLSVNYLDRFLSTVNINKNQFQLCASVCILLASKFSQVVPITTEKLVIYTDNSVTVEELRQWEIKILNVLQWELSSVTTHSFLEHFIPGLSLSSKVNIPKVRRHAETIAALAATEYKFILAKQSVIAAAALAAAVKGLVKDQTETEHVVNSLAARIKCQSSEIMFYVQHLDHYVEQLVTPQQCSQDSFLLSFSSVYTCKGDGSTTPTDTVRASNAVAA